MAGADIRKLSGALPGRPTADIILSLEQCSKPVVAALQGNALGGGLEFALACHYRCALASTKLGLPEVNIGLIPGAGGTQRLPRLIGIANALELISTGKTVTAAQALQMGLVDRIVSEADLLDQAVTYAQQLVDTGAQPRRVSELTVPGIADLQAMLAEAGKSLARSRRGELAPQKAIEALHAAATLPFAEGIAAEARLFAECRASAQSRALQHLFMAERHAAKLTTAVPGMPQRPIQSAGVLGGGTMGRGIAMAFANAGLAVTLIESDAAAANRALSAIAAVYAGSVAKGRMTQSESAACQSRICGSVELQDFARLDLIIEAVFEDMALKRRIFADLDRICRPGAILATNTSALDIDVIAAATTRPQDVLGLHFFSPAQVMRLVEVVRGARTAPEVLASAMALIKSLRKIGVVAGNCDGFIGNRMLMGYRREAEFLLLEGATPAQVDKALVDFGMSMGPHTMGDMAGLDVSAAGRKRRRAEGKLPADERFGLIADELVAAGRLGQKSGGGFYRYEKGSHQALEDPLVEQLIVAQAQRLNIARRAISDDEIVARCIYPLINEGARILSEGMAQRPGDIDVVWVNGYGFPRARGGPMQYADEIGLANVLEMLRRFERVHGPLYWQAAPLLCQLVDEGKSFRSMN
jgi:3-hydroxyacyl-CoA dehydrogenase